MSSCLISLFTNALSPLGIFVTVLVILASLYLWKKPEEKSSKLKDDYKDKSKPKSRPGKWVKVGRVKKLLVYPVKACGAVEVEKGVMTKLAFKCHNANIRDRDFMVVNEFGKMMLMDKYPTMALIKFDIHEDDKLTVKGPDMPDFTFTYPTPNEDNQRVCRIDHDRHVKVLDCGDEVAQWFQEYLGDSTLRLYYYHLDDTQRTFQAYMYKCPQYELSDLGSFQNETSYLICAEESISELNKHLDKDSSWKNWRPNILIDQVAKPFAELNWPFVKIGDGNATMKAAAPCARCRTVTVDNDLGILPEDGEPLKTLKELNTLDLVDDKKLLDAIKNTGLMGIRLGLYLPAGEGHIIKVGDPVYAAFPE